MTGAAWLDGDGSEARQQNKHRSRTQAMAAIMHPAAPPEEESAASGPLASLDETRGFCPPPTVF